MFAPCKLTFILTPSFISFFLALSCHGDWTILQLNSWFIHYLYCFVYGSSKAWIATLFNHARTTHNLESNFSVTLFIQAQLMPTKSLFKICMCIKSIFCKAQKNLPKKRTHRQMFPNCNKRKAMWRNIFKTHFAFLIHGLCCVFLSFVWKTPFALLISMYIVSCTYDHKLVCQTEKTAEISFYKYVPSK